MTWWWPDQGIDHSRSMLTREVAYLNRNFKRSIVTSSPAGLARGFADTSYRWLFLRPGLAGLLRRLEARPPSSEPGWFSLLRTGYAPVSRYVLAAMYISQLFAVRLAVIVLALPAFLLFGLVALAEGLAKRDLRRWGGGRESSFVYHYAKRALAPVIILPVVVYLALPVSLHPSWVFLPFAALFAFALVITTTTFKKYI